MHALDEEFRFLGRRGRFALQRCFFRTRTQAEHIEEFFPQCGFGDPATRPVF